MKNRVMFGIVALFVLALGLPSGAQAANWWHPWRNEVLRRDNRLSHEINYDRGRLGGHYGQLMNEDRAVRNQEWRDARLNGGYLTPREYRHFNHEENGIQHQINHDYRGW